MAGTFYPGDESSGSDSPYGIQLRWGPIDGCETDSDSGIPMPFSNTMGTAIDLSAPVAMPFANTLDTAITFSDDSEEEEQSLDDFDAGAEQDIDMSVESESEDDVKDQAQDIAPAVVVADPMQPEPTTIAGRVEAVLKMSPQPMTRGQIHTSLQASFPAWWAASAKTHSISAAITTNVGKKFATAAWDKAQTFTTFTD